MATRFYLPSSGTPPATPAAFSAGWIKTLDAVGPFPAVITPGGTAMTTAVINADTGAPEDFVCAGRWVSSALDAQTIDGSITGVMRCAELVTDLLDATIAIAIKVIQPGGADRGILLATTASDAPLVGAGTAPPEMALTTQETRRFQDAAESDIITLGSVAAQAGDFLVIEIGMRELLNSTTVDGAFRYGDNGGADFAHTDGLLTDLNPWVEFSGDIAFQVGMTSSPGAVTIPHTFSLFGF